MKLAVVGIDGGELSLINKWRDELPILNYLMSHGQYGELESTLPPITCPAWASMFSGLNPGELGMYYFVDMKGTWRVFQSDAWADKAVWKNLNGGGISTGIFNVPITYPPYPVNGWMVSGIGTPAGARTICWPEELRYELGSEYIVTAPAILTIKGKEVEYAWIFKAQMHRKVEAAKLLLSKHPVDLAITVFDTTDQAQHYFWHHIDETHPRFVPNSPHKNVIKEMYQEVDRYIGWLMKTYPDTEIMVVSDHGFTAFKKCLSLNRWLEQKGYLRFNKPQNQNLSRQVLHAARNYLMPRLNPKLAHVAIQHMPKWLLRRVSTIEDEANREQDVLSRIDWEHTTAYSLGISAGIYLSDGLNGAKGVVGAALLEDLRQLPVSMKVHLKNEIYHGAYLDKAPDLVIEPTDWHPAALQFDGKLWPEPFTSGMHRQNGVIMRYGKGLEAQHTELQLITNVANIITEVCNGILYSLPTRP